MYKNVFDPIHPPSPISSFWPPSIISLTASHLLCFLVQQAQFVLPYACGYRAIHCSLGNTLGAALLKKTDFPSSSSHHHPEALQVGKEVLGALPSPH